MLYGWSIVGTCFFINLYTNGAVQYGFTAFLEPIVREFGWSYAQVSLAASIRGFEMGLLAPIAGLLIYRLGPRWLVFTGTCSIGLGLMPEPGPHTPNVLRGLHSHINGHGAHNRRSAHDGSSSMVQEEGLYGDWHRGEWDRPRRDHRAIGNNVD